MTWKLWNHRKSYLEFKNRFNWVSKQQFVEDRDYTYLLCEGIKEDGRRCSLVYKKNCFQMKLVLFVSLMHQQIYIKTIKLINQKMITVFTKYFLREYPRFSDMNIAIWKNMENSAWRDANIYEKLFLAFCLAFDYVSGELTNNENEFWSLTLDAEKKFDNFFLIEKLLYHNRRIYFYKFK